MTGLVELTDIREKLRPTLWNISDYTEPLWTKAIESWEETHHKQLSRFCDSCLRTVWNWLETL